MTEHDQSELESLKDAASKWVSEHGNLSDGKPQLDVDFFTVYPRNRDFAVLIYNRQAGAHAVHAWWDVYARNYRWIELDQHGLGLSPSETMPHKGSLTEFIQWLDKKTFAWFTGKVN